MLRMIRSVTIALLAIAALAAATLPSARAQTFPALSGRVVDDAGVLDPAVRRMLVAKLADLEAKTSDQVVVATVRSLQGLSVEDYANRLFRRWRLGQRTTNNGVLLLVAPNDHKVRIEVGYGLEGTLPDAVAKLIIADRMLSRLRANQFDGAVEAGVNSVVDVLTGDAAEWKQRAAARPHKREPGQLPWAVGLILMLVFGAAFLAFFGFWAVMILAATLRGLIAIHLLPQHNDRQGGWHWLDWFDDGKPTVRRRGSSGLAWATSSSSRSSDDDSFSGGGGSSGGGGASGSW